MPTEAALCRQLNASDTATHGAIAQLFFCFFCFLFVFVLASLTLLSLLSLSFVLLFLLIDWLPPSSLLSSLFSLLFSSSLDLLLGRLHHHAHPTHTADTHTLCTCSHGGVGEWMRGRNPVTHKTKHNNPNKPHSPLPPSFSPRVCVLCTLGTDTNMHAHGACA